MRERTPFLAAAVLFLLLGIVPVATMFAASLFDGGRFSTEAYRALWHNRALAEGMVHSLMLAVTVASATTATGTVLGILLARSDLWLRKSFAVLLSLPLLIPSYILAYGYAAWFGEWFFGFWGVATVLFVIYLCVPMLLVMFALRQIDPALEEAGLLLCGWGGVLRGISLPLIAPVILFAFLLVFILVFGEFGVANFLRYPVFVTQSFVYFSAFYDFRAAAAAALPVIVVVFVVLAMERLLRSGFAQMQGSGAALHMIVLGRGRIPLFIAVGLLALAVTGMPLLALMKQSDISAFMRALESASGPLGRSLLFAAVGATLLTLLGFASAYIVHRRLLGWWRWFEGSLFFMFALPASVYGVALILFWNTPWTNFIYATPAIVLIAYTGKYLALPAKITEARLAQIPSAYSEAAALCGAQWHTVIRHILLPLIRPALVLAWVVAYIFCLRDDALVMLLYPPGNETLPVYILTQMANGAPSLIASLCLLMVAVTLLPVGLYGLWQSGRRT